VVGCQEIAVENGWISNFEGLVTLTLTLDWVILHTVVHHWILNWLSHLPSITTEQWILQQRNTVNPVCLD